MPRLAKPRVHCEGCVGDTWVHPIPPLNRTFTAPHTGFSQGEGHATNGVTCIGEALGQNEDADGLPFRPAAQAGSLLERAFKRLGYSREQFRINNIVRCRPPHDHLADAWYEAEVIRHCRPYLDDELTKFKPRCILALGGTAARELTGLTGAKQGVSFIRGYAVPSILPSALGVPVVSTFHPSFLRQGKPQYFGTLAHDIQRAVQIARDGLPAPLERRYQLRPSIDEALAFRNRCALELNRWLTYDIETPTSAETSEDERDEIHSIEMTQIQFSLAPGEGIVFPIAGAPTEYMEIARDIMVMGHRKASFYGHLFDDPRLRYHRFNFGGPFPHDLYEMWHHMQPDLPANLQFVASFYGMDEPWKHLFGADLPYYGCCDVDAPQRILERLPEQLRKRGLWDGYERLVYQVRPILDRMQDRGIPINDAKRIAFGAELDKAAAELYEQMQALVPDELKNVEPKHGYKRVPKDTAGMVLRSFDVPAADTELKSPGIVAIERWCRLQPFKPSSQQMIRYMRHKGHPVPKKRKTDKDTSEAVELERLSRKTHDPLYKKVIWYREVLLMKATFVDGWAPGGDGRVHTTFTFAPATGQLSSRGPNVQTGPEHEKEGGRAINLAEEFQKIVEAPQGYKIINCIAPYTNILFADLLWRTAEHVRVGDFLWGFDEFPVNMSGGKNLKRPARYLRKTAVTAVTKYRKPCLRITTDMGIVECSKDHNWLKRTAGVAVWRRADVLKVGQSLCYFTQPWKPKADYDTGWLSGFLDGEGYASNGRMLGFGQNDGDTARRAVELFAKIGFEARRRESTVGIGGKCHSYHIVGGQFTWLRALGTVRPQRILKTVIDGMEGMTYWGKKARNARVLHIEDIGEQDVIAIETDRHTFIAEGLLSHNCDHKSFHALTLAHLAQDKDYERVVRLDVHSFLASQFLKLKSIDTMIAMKDDELRDYLKWIKKEHRFTRDYKCKRVILGWGFGRGYRSIYEAYMESFENESEAKRLVQTLEGCFPKTVRWRRAIMQKAHYDTYLISPFKFIRWFWDVHHFGPNGEIRNGDQAEQAIAFLPANCAFGMMREQARTFDGTYHESNGIGLDERYGMINNVHDSWKFCCADALVEECLHVVKGIMEAPCPTLNGLWCAVQPSVGQNNATKSDTNPGGKEEVSIDPAPLPQVPA